MKQLKEIKNKNNNLKQKNIIFNQSQNGKHYDKGLKIYEEGNNYVFFQVTYHKSNDDLKEFLNNLWLDLNFMINKIKYL